MKFLLQLLLFYILSIQVQAQTQQLNALGTIDHYKNTSSNISALKKAIKLSNGDSFIIGTKDETYTTLDVFVAKLNSNMDTLWTYVITTPDQNSLDNFRNAEVDQNGNLYVYTVSLINFNLYTTDNKHYVTKLSSTGSLIFQKSLEDVALQLNEPANYTTTNYRFIFTHLDDNNNFVLVYTAHSPNNKVTFFKFSPNNTESIEHRTDILPYDPQVDLYGYTLSFYYEKGNYYYLTGVKKGTSSSTYEYRINKLLTQGYASLNVSSYTGSGQYLIVLKNRELKSNLLGNVLYFTFESFVSSQSYITLAISDQLTYLGHYQDNVRMNSFHNSQILPNGSIRLFGMSKLNSFATTAELSEVIISPTGTITKDVLDYNFTGNEIIAIDESNIGVIYDDHIDVVDNQWQTVEPYSNISVNNVKLFVKDGTSFNVFAQQSNQIVPNSSDFYDNVASVAYKLPNRSNIYPHYIYQGKGSASTFYRGVHKILSDNSSIIFYSYSIGMSTGATGVSSKDYIKKLDKNYNVVFENSVNNSLFSNAEIDNLDNIYFGTTSLDQQQNYVYYLQKMQSNGTVVFNTLVDTFDKVLVHNNKLYTIDYTLTDNVIKEYDMVTGSYKQTILLPESSRPVNQFIDANNDLYYYFAQHEHIPNTYNSKSKLIIYKNFQKIQEIVYGIDYEVYFQSVIDPVTKSIYFAAVQNGTSVYKIFKVNLNGTYAQKNITKPYDAVVFENNSVYFQDNDKLYQIDKNTLNIKKDINRKFTSRFYKYKNYILHTDFLSSEIEMLNEDLNNVATFNLESNFEFLYFDNDDRLHIHNSITKGYLLNSYPRWIIDRTQLYDLNQLALSVNDLENALISKISVFPNPTTGVLNVELNDEIKKIDVYDVSGKKVLMTQKNQFNLESLSNGIYLLKIYTKTNKTLFHKVIKK
ncbi:T9SS type A sorting domain-containing protein [Myroides sp. JBRI-B21084]|uniref:T9SS type A sorting domain-containing protein n=1 Tax=Myroides sp. JBRI-B21084 TaxID=3119977 RepID=UPI0026E2F2AA|nr:T9SS type A sorting domain-containing protein [Paenimyroides cloacae]WKW46043.1 T9SS type A sorting domain-containing protein [Paenimyroides cloacae]